MIAGKQKSGKPQKIGNPQKSVGLVSRHSHIFELLSKLPSHTIVCVPFALRAPAHHRNALAALQGHITQIITAGKNAGIFEQSSNGAEIRYESSATDKNVCTERDVCFVYPNIRIRVDNLYFHRRMVAELFNLHYNPEPLYAPNPHNWLKCPDFISICIKLLLPQLNSEAPSTESYVQYIGEPFTPILYKEYNTAPLLLLEITVSLDRTLRSQPIYKASLLKVMREMADDACRQRVTTASENGFDITLTTTQRKKRGKHELIKKPAAITVSGLFLSNSSKNFAAFNGWLEAYLGRFSGNNAAPAAPPSESSDISGNLSGAATTASAEPVRQPRRIPVASLLN